MSRPMCSRCAMWPAGTTHACMPVEPATIAETSVPVCPSCGCATVQHCVQCNPSWMLVVGKLRDEVASLRALLADLRRGHINGMHRCASLDDALDDCSCGADKHNARIDQALGEGR